MTKKTLHLKLSLYFCLWMLLTATCGWTAVQGELIIYHAGSLTVPFKAMIQQFEEVYPDVKVKTKSGGSTKMARLISEKGEIADIMASADYKVIDTNLIPEYADWNIRFATNRLVLCFTEKSTMAAEVNSENWHKILRDKRVNWGHSDPNLDPCGYRSLMVMQLAEKYYNSQDLYENLLANRPEKNIKTKAIQLVKLLKNGQLDYAWEYRSVAVQHGLKFVELDDRMNLGNYRFDPLYQTAQVEVTGKKGNTPMVKKGKSITYGVTKIKNGPNQEAADAFLEFLLSTDKGLQVLEEMGQPPYKPARVSTARMKASLPASLSELVEVKS